MQNIQAENKRGLRDFGSEVDMNETIQDCLNCFRSCEETLAKRFKEKTNVNSELLILIKSCAEICHTAAKFMMMQSKFHEETCSLCAKVCTECADMCEAQNEQTLKQCVDACRKCAKSCLEMAQLRH